MTPEQVVAAAPGQVRVVGANPPPGARSWLADGRCVVWSPPHTPGVDVALDAELATQPVPRALAERSGISDAAEFWPRWTAVEVACKLRGVSLAGWLRTRGLEPDPDLATRTFRLGDVVVTCAAVASGAR